MDIDLIMICLKETFPDTIGLGLKATKYYNLNETTKIFNIFGGLTFYYVIIFFYYKISDPGIQNIIPVITEIPNVIPKQNIENLFVIFNNTAHKLMLENNIKIMNIFYQEFTHILDTLKHLDQLYPDRDVDIDKVADVFRENMIKSIKEDKELFKALHNNDLIVKYIGSICREAYINDTIFEVLNIKEKL